MPDKQYCYPGTEVLINKLNIKNKHELFMAEKELTAIRLRELQKIPIKGKFDFKHLKSIHKYIFQDIYTWAGKERTVEIGKGNLFCTTSCIQDYAASVFEKYYPQCYAAKDDISSFVKVFADNYGDVNALHPFREGNGRAQREFARVLCLKCGFTFDLSCATHKEMLEASKLSFDKGDSSGLVHIFSKAVTANVVPSFERLNILTSDDLTIGLDDMDDYYGYEEYEKLSTYNEIYKAKITEMYRESNMHHESTIYQSLEERIMQAQGNKQSLTVKSGRRKNVKDQEL